MRKLALALPLVLLAACGDDRKAPSPAAPTNTTALSEASAPIRSDTGAFTQAAEEKLVAARTKVTSINRQAAPTADQAKAIAKVAAARRAVPAHGQSDFRLLLDCWKRDNGTDVIPAEVVIKASLTVTDDPAQVAKCRASLKR